MKTIIEESIEKVPELTKEIVGLLNKLDGEMDRPESIRIVRKWYSSRLDQLQERVEELETIGDTGAIWPDDVIEIIKEM